MRSEVSRACCGLRFVLEALWRICLSTFWRVNEAISSSPVYTVPLSLVLVLGINIAVLLGCSK